MTKTGLVYDECFLEHAPALGPEHPEQPDRLRAIVSQLQADSTWDRMTRLPFESADLAWITRLHDPAYVARCFEACRNGEAMIDVADSAICPRSAEVAQLAVGGVLAAVDAVMRGDVANALCLVRPPGHHAEAERSMGFCLFNNVAIAAEYLIEKHGLQRVAIVDFDVHHGNGTQHLFEQRSQVLFISLHEHPRSLYPGTGYVHEIGQGAGHGHTVNIPLDPGADDMTYRQAFVFKVSPVLKAFKPQFLLLSSGFDASTRDGMAHMDVTPQGFEWITRFLKNQAESLCDGRLVSVLEGGYDLQSLAESVALHTRVLLESTQSEGMMAVKSGFF